MPVRETHVTEEPVAAVRDGAILTLTLNRPDNTNAINGAMRKTLLGHLREAKADARVRTVVLTGAGEEAFSTGLDIAELSTLTAAEAEPLAFELRAIHEALLALDVPVIAAIKGSCVGSGLELALHCDLRFARGDARFAFPGINIGLVPGGGSIERLTQLTGSGAATALLMTGSVINAERAFLVGLASNVIAPNSFDGAITEFSHYLAGLSPVAMRELKALLRLSAGAGTQAMVARGAQALRACVEEGDLTQRLQGLYEGPGPDTTVH